MGARLNSSYLELLLFGNGWPKEEVNNMPGKCLCCGNRAQMNRFYCDECTEILIDAGVPSIGEDRNLKDYTIYEMLQALMDGRITEEEMKEEIDSREYSF